MFEGITSQYGFLYQKYYFIMNAISHASMDLFFTYEGMDDIDVDIIDTAEELSMITKSSNEYIQVKSGNVSRDCWAKVLGNWLLIDEYKNKFFVLVCENALDFDVNDDETIEAVYKYFEKGKDKRRNAVARKVHDLFFLNNDESSCKELIKDLSKNTHIKVLSIDEIMIKLSRVIIDTYCADIRIYERAKKARCERLVVYLLAEIDAAIKSKMKYTLTFQKLIEIVGKVQKEISDNRYRVDTAEIRKRKQEEAENLVKNSGLREIRQLKLVKNDSAFITQAIINELLYKDFRDIYASTGIEISNIEDIAYTNYQDALFSFDNNPTPKELFNRTIDKEIDSTITQNSPIYRKGCYVYLTGGEIEMDRQISWGIEDE